MTEQNPVGPKTAAVGRKWNEGLTVDFKAMFVDLGKAVIAGHLGSPVGATTNAMNAIKAVGKAPLTAQQAARRWILRSLVRAVYELVGQSWGSGTFGVLSRTEEDLQRICDGLDLQLMEEPVVLSRDFLDRPDRIPLVEGLEEPLAEWLRGMDVNPEPAQTVARNLGGFFVRSLRSGWGEDLSHEDRQQILVELGNPAALAEEREWAWGEYHARLEREVAEPVFGIEPFSLEQIHVDLFGYTEEDAESQGDRRGAARVLMPESVLGELRGTHGGKKKVVVGRAAGRR